MTALLLGAGPGVAAAIGGGGGGVTALAFQSSAVGSTAGLTCPTVLAGDIIVYNDFCESSGTTPTTVVPTGFTQIANTNNSGARKHITSYKKAAGTEGGTTITGMSDLKMDKVLLVFRPTGTLTTITLGSVSSQYNPAAAPTNQTVTASGGTAPLVVLGFYDSNSVVSSRGFSTTKTGELEQFANNDVWTAYKFYNSAPADTTISMTVQGSMHSCYLAAS